MTREPHAFFSYAHKDDVANNGRLTKLRERLETEVSVQWGKDFRIFQDRNMAWGTSWAERINTSLDTVMFLIPIVTPSFFNSEACRDELSRFISREKTIGRNDLILPFYFMSAPLLERSDLRNGDSLAQTLSSRQYRDWRHLRFSDLDSQEFCSALASAARQLVDALESNIGRLPRNGSGSSAGAAGARPQHQAGKPVVEAKDEPPTKGPRALPVSRTDKEAPHEKDPPTAPIRKYHVRMTRLSPGKAVNGSPTGSNDQKSAQPMETVNAEAKAATPLPSDDSPPKPGKADPTTPLKSNDGSTPQKSRDGNAYHADLDHINHYMTNYSTYVPSDHEKKIVADAENRIRNEVLKESANGSPKDVVISTMNINTKNIIVDQFGDKKKGCARSINSAIQMADDGAHIYVKAGTYFESVVIDRPLNIMPLDSAVPIIRSDEGPAIVVRLDRRHTRHTLVHLSGFSISQKSGHFNQDPAILIENSELRISKCVVEGHLGPAVTVKKGAFIYAEGCQISSYKHDGITLEGNSGGFLSSNYIMHCRYGVVVSERCQPKIIGNEIFNCAVSGVFIKNFATPVLNANSIHDNSQNGITSIKAAKPDVRGNEIYNNGGYAVHFDLGANGTYIDNVFYDNGRGDSNRANFKSRDITWAKNTRRKR